MIASRPASGRRPGWKKSLMPPPPTLQRALAAKPPLEMCRRLERLLEGLNPDSSAERLCALRALKVLEQMDTAGARQLLNALAGGLPEARLTREAGAALERLAKRPAPEP
jgi:hypothetical protein